MSYYKPHKDGIYSLPGTDDNRNCAIGSFEVVATVKGEATNFLCDWPKDAPCSCRIALPVEGRTFFVYFETAVECDRWTSALQRLGLVD